MDCMTYVNIHLRSILVRCKDGRYKDVTDRIKCLLTSEHLMDLAEKLGWVEPDPEQYAEWARERGIY